jgi:hypothetical protein
MTDSDAIELRLPHVAARFLLWGILASAIYLLSIGPAYWLLLGRSTFASERALRVYTPVYRLAEMAPISDLFGSYCTWWAELPGGAIERMLHDTPN